MSNQENPGAAAPSRPLSAETINRRKFIGAGSAALVATVALSRAQGQNIEKVAGAQHDHSASDVGPENVPMRDAQPDTFLPPPTDHGEVPSFWSTFATAHRRVEEGGWSRQVTVTDFPLSKEIAGVNMRLVAGGVRELHWHEASEWSIMLNGNARLTAIDAEGRSYVKDVTKNDLWLFPAGLPHSIHGLGPDGCEFLLVFDDGKFSEGDTTLISEILPADGDAQETLQDVFMEVWRRADTFDPDKGKALGWLITMARRRAIDRYRKVLRHAVGGTKLRSASEAVPGSVQGVGTEVLETEPLRETRAATNDLRAFLTAALRGLPEEQAQVIHLIYFEELSQRAVAARTGLPLGTIKTRLELARRKLFLRFEGMRAEIQYAR